MKGRLFQTCLDSVAVSDLIATISTVALVAAVSALKSENQKYVFKMAGQKQQFKSVRRRT